MTNGGRELFLQDKGLAVSTLIHSRVGLMGADLDAVQGAIVLILTVIPTCGNGTLNTLICVAVHRNILLQDDCRFDTPRTKVRMYQE